MDKYIFTGVDGNFGGIAAETAIKLLDKSQLIFTAPTEKGIAKYRDQGYETRVTDFNDPDGLAKAFQGAKKVLLPMMCAADFGTVPPELLGSFQIIFYNSAEDAVFKALGVE